MPQVFSYKVKYYGGGRGNRHPYRAMITFHGTRESPDSRATTGAAIFYRDPATMPTEDTQSEAGFITCNLSWEDFSSVLDLLRNEGPVWVGYSDETRMAWLETQEESVGEGEDGAPDG